MFTRVTAKLGGQRKARQWSVQPVDTGELIVQTEGAIGKFWPQTGKGVLCTRGGYFPHLALAEPFEFPQAFVDACMLACPEPGGETSFGGVTFVHSVRTI